MATERIISADSHVNPPRDLWTRDVPASFTDRAPRVESTPQGDFWIVDSQVTGAVGLDASAGLKPEEFRRLQTRALSSVLEGYGIDPAQFPPEAVLVLVTALSQILVQEEALGITMGHADIRAVVERCLTHYEGDASI